MTREEYSMEYSEAQTHLFKLRIEALERKWEILQDLIKNNPNDADLGRLVRQSYKETPKKKDA